MHDQAAALRRLVERTNIRKQGKTISFVSGKGGVGKSNVAINFSIELLKKNKKVLLIDLDIGMGNIEVLLGLHAKYTIVDLFNKQLSIHDIIETGPNNLGFISGGSALTDFFVMDEEKTNYFLAQYEEIVQIYDYIIFDMGAGVSPTSLFYILASDECIVITTPEPTSITDAYSMIKHLMNNQSNIPIYVVMNRANSLKSGLKALQRFKRVVTQFLEKDIKILGILPDDKSVSQAVIKQTPFVLLYKRSAIARAIEEISNTYLADTKSLNKNEPVSFIQKFKKLIRER